MARRSRTDSLAKVKQGVVLILPDGTPETRAEGMFRRVGLFSVTND